MKSIFKSLPPLLFEGDELVALCLLFVTIQRQLHAPAAVRITDSPNRSTIQGSVQLNDVVNLTCGLYTITSTFLLSDDRGLCALTIFFTVVREYNRAMHSKREARPVIEIANST